MAQKQAIDAGFAWDKPFQFSQVVRAGDFLFLAGQVSVDGDGNVVGEGDIRAQTRKVFENIQTVLAAAGSGLDDIIEFTSFHTNLADLEGVAEVKAEFLTKDFPAWTALGVTSL